MAKDERGAAVRPEDEISRRVHRYEHALVQVLRMRPDEERGQPITNAEHLLAVQVAEAVTAYERQLRRAPMPRAPAPAAPVVRRKRAAPPPAPKRRRRRRRAKQAAPETAVPG